LRCGRTPLCFLGFRLFGGWFSGKAGGGVRERRVLARLVGCGAGGG
jgi:hypothetical protein